MTSDFSLIKLIYSELRMSLVLMYLNISSSQNLSHLNSVWMYVIDTPLCLSEMELLHMMYWYVKRKISYY